MGHGGMEKVIAKSTAAIWQRRTAPIPQGRKLIMMLTKNQLLTLAIEEVNNLGFGVSHAENGQVVFVSAALRQRSIRPRNISK